MKKYSLVIPGNFRKITRLVGI